MESNEHGIMEQNEEHLETNISINYRHETELYAESYDAMNMGTYCQNQRRGGGREKVNRSGSRSGPSSGAVVELSRQMSSS